MRRKLLFSTAAVALLAGTGLAVAQGTPQSQPPSSTQQQPAATQDQGKADQGKTEQDKSRRGMDSRAQSDQGTRSQSDQGTRAQQGQSQRSQSQEGQKSQQGQSQQQGQAGQQQGQAGQSGAQSGAAASITVDQRTKIREVVLKDRNAPRVSNVNFSLTVGTAVPRSVKVVAVPQSIVEIHPAWRGYMYFVVNDEIIIVEPKTLKIVAVINA